ncbi:MAG TPA: DUF1993 family protein [Xanthobacteraceae bacterium]|nr:DUF1993 family protein [Xanthobacteraceae bacterium]
MSLSMYQACVPVFVQRLSALAKILDKAAAHAEARKIDPAALLNARLFPDMFPLVRQVQLATDFAKGCAGRLAGVELPRYADEEKSFGELKQRIEKTLAFLKGLSAAQIDGTEDKEITFPIAGTPTTFKGQQYLLHSAMPNFYFHVTTAYAILRHNGVEIGKRDFTASS